MRAIVGGNVKDRFRLTLLPGALNLSPAGHVSPMVADPLQPLYLLFSCKLIIYFLVPFSRCQWVG